MTVSQDKNQKSTSTAIAAMIDDARRQAMNHVPRLRIDLAHRRALAERLGALEAELAGAAARADADGAVLDGALLQRQVVLLRAQEWARTAAGYVDGALVDLAHAPEAFAVIEAENLIEPSLAQHFRDTVADELAYAPLQGVSAEAAVLAALAQIPELLVIAEGMHEKAFALIWGRG